VEEVLRAARTGSLHGLQRLRCDLPVPCDHDAKKRKIAVFSPDDWEAVVGRSKGVGECRWPRPRNRPPLHLVALAIGTPWPTDFAWNMSISIEARHFENCRYFCRYFSDIEGKNPASIRVPI